MAYVDGFVIPVRKDRLEDYKALARTASQVWRELGALAYVETVADDAPVGERTSFPRAVQLRDDEIVIFSWIIYESRAARDEINAQAMKDPRFPQDFSALPFDSQRMIHGGFIPFLQD